MSDKLTFARELVQNSLKLIERVLFNKPLAITPSGKIQTKTLSQLIDHMLILRWHLTTRTNIVKRRHELALRICQITIADLYEL
ncbi:Hypothetical protein PACV_142 [Pacmanvirus A23]|uniref:Hypothetical protein n=1 Tax=Pacmanvirus A23 TaxID=1932881 RepID=UPI000A095A74|nr:Hypothetical protein B9W72_gp140 [Pacmanvirus A23]SIP85857.1 Hypothetical protein PACV_142 [Pacmanvirus A23]